MIITNIADGSRVKTYQGCSTTHQFHFNGSDWIYQVARFKFDNTIDIRSRVRLRGTNALSLTGEKIVMDIDGSLEVKTNSIPSPFQDARFVGGFVPMAGSSGL